MEKSIISTLPSLFWSAQPLSPPHQNIMMLKSKMSTRPSPLKSPFAHSTSSGARILNVFVSLSSFARHQEQLLLRARCIRRPQYPLNRMMLATFPAHLLLFGSLGCREAGKREQYRFAESCTLYWGESRCARPHGERLWLAGQKFPR